LLYPCIDSSSILNEVQEAVQILLNNQKIRLGQEGYELLIAEGKQWEERRQGLRPKAHEEKSLKKRLWRKY
jgi:hypothetical protein